MEINKKRISLIDNNNSDNDEADIIDFKCSDYLNEKRKNEVNNVLSSIISKQVLLKEAIENVYICLMCKLKYVSKQEYQLHNINKHNEL